MQPEITAEALVDLLGVFARAGIEVSLDGATAPTRVTIQAPSPLPGIDVEIDAVAHCPA